jgi:hypothetical protein
MNGALEFPAPLTGYSNCNIIILGFMYTLDVAAASPSSGYSSLVIPPSPLPSWARFACNVFGLNNGTTSPYVIPDQLAASLRAWKAVDPGNRKVLIGVGGATAAPPYAQWAQSLDNIQLVVAGIAEFFANVTTFPLDGVDIDYEDTAALWVPGNTSGRPPYDGIGMLTSLTQQLRQSTQTAKLLLSHAPQTPYLLVEVNAQPYFASYLVILAKLAALGVRLDYVNIQAYNNSPYDGCPVNAQLMDTLLNGQTLPATVVGTDGSTPAVLPPLPPQSLLLGQQLVQPPPIMPWCGGPQVPYGLMFWLQDANTARAVNNCVMPQWFKQMPPSGHGSSGHGSSGGKGHSASGHSAGGHSAGGHSAGGHSASGHSAGGHSAGGHSAGGHSASGHSAGGHSPSGHSAGGHSAGGHSAGGHPAVENSSASFFLHDQGAALGNMVAFTVMIALLVVVIALASVLVHKAVTK